jgi:predicted ATPase
MRIREISISGHRSLRAIRFPVGGLTVFVGANGVSKTNLYRALQLLQAEAAGRRGRGLSEPRGFESFAGITGRDMRCRRGAATTQSRCAA